MNLDQRGRPGEFQNGKERDNRPKIDRSRAVCFLAKKLYVAAATPPAAFLGKTD